MYRNSKHTVIFPLILSAGVVLGILLGQYLGRHDTASQIRGMLSHMSVPSNKLTYTLSLIENRYVDSVSMDSLAEHVIPLLVRELDPHSVYIPASEMAALNEPLEGEFDGIGVVFNMATDTVIVLNVIPQGPSDKAGIKAGDRIIEIDPGMAFGSGTHETTSMCLELLEDAMHGGESVIDVGTGSGILAIGAAMLGAKDVLAIDIDPVAVRVAKENIEHNHLSDRVRAVEGNLLASSDGVCDLCVANIIADVICMFAQPLVDHIVPGGLFICSGIIKEREQDVVNALTAADYTILETKRKGEWVAMLSRRKK